MDVHEIYEKCCVLTTWKFIDFHVKPSLDTNGNEQFIWVVTTVVSELSPIRIQINSPELLSLKIDK